MPNKRKVVLANGETYHIFNRSIASQEILVGRKELQRMLDLIDYYRFPQALSFSKYKNLTSEMKTQYTSNFKKNQPLVEIYAFCFMPTHFHLLLKQISEKGITIFASKFQNGFAKYFNKITKRDGGVFNRPFKAKRIATDDELAHVSRYIHLNPITSYLITPEELATYDWTSHSFYMGKGGGDIVNIEFLLKIFGSSEKYEKFILDQVEYQRSLDQIKKLL
ncbi:transposase [Patescibacteria group bacterium]|nr:transposase [Patescibacteria group bacterium]